MTAIAITANILFAGFVLIAIVGSHLWAITGSRTRKPARTFAPQRNSVSAIGPDFARSGPAEAAKLTA